LYYARLPFGEAQAVLGSTGPIKGSAQSALCGWHGQSLHPETGSFVLVNENGPLAGLVGDRLKITLRDRPSPAAVVAYCIGRDALDDDLSLTRRLFLQLALLSSTNIPVTVEVLG
jgi:hypothetical protein